MAKTILKERAISLRSQGASLNEITQKLKIPKSTVRYWCRDIILSPTQQKKIFNKLRLGGVLSAEKLRKRRIELTTQLIHKGKDEIGKLSKREKMLIGSALYWAEGYRKGDGEFGFTNSDPRMISFMVRWLKESAHVSLQDIHLRVCINAAHSPRLIKIKKYWSHVTGIPISQFSKPTLIKVSNTKVYKNSDSYFGTLRVKVRRSTNLRRHVMGWIEGIAINT